MTKIRLALNLTRNTTTDFCSTYGCIVGIAWAAPARALRWPWDCGCRCPAPSQTQYDALRSSSYHLPPCKSSHTRSSVLLKQTNANKPSSARQLATNSSRMSRTACALFNTHGAHQDHAQGLAAQTPPKRSQNNVQDQRFCMFKLGIPKF